MIKYFIFICIFFISTQTYAIDNFYMISELGVSAKSKGIANISGFTHSAAGLFENPASIKDVNGTSVSTFYTDLLGEVGYLGMIGSYPLDFGTISLGFVQADSVGFRKTQRVGGQVVETGETFDSVDRITKLAFTYYWNPYVSFGVAASHFFRKIDTITGSAVNADFGAYLEFDKLRMSYVISNLVFNTTVPFSNDGEEALATQFFVSSAYKFNSRFEFFTELKYLGAGTDLRKSFAVKYIPMEEYDYFYLAGGYRELLTVTRDARNTYSIGIGLELGNINLYVTYDRSDYLPQKNPFFLSIDWVF